MLEIFSLLFLFVSVPIYGNGVLSLDASYNPRTGHAAKRSNDANDSTLLVFHEDLLERRVKSSDVIFIGTIVKLDDKNKIINDAQNILTKNYSNDNEVVDSNPNESEYFTLFHGNPKLIDSDGNVNLMRKKEEIGRKKMMGMVEVERVLKGGYLLSLMPRYGRITKDDLGRGISSKKWVLVHDINKFSQKLKKRTLKKMHLNNNNDKIANNNNNEQLKVNDTKIFFLKEMQPQMLHLNSSLIDDTANNVKMLEYVVRTIQQAASIKNSNRYRSKYLQHWNRLQLTREVSITNNKDPCFRLHCPPETTCKIIYNGTHIIPSCLCPDFCQLNLKPTQNAVDGRNDDKNEVGDDASTLCGSDGKDYEDVCEMRNINCRKEEHVTVKFSGRCDPCSSFKCESPAVCRLNEETRQPYCDCGTLCPMTIEPVCGSDGRTYINECFLKGRACARNDDVIVQFSGECSSGPNPCLDLECGVHEQCRIDYTNTAHCTCPQHCPAVYRPVCGSDGLTYDSECHLKLFACNKNLNLLVKREGVCPNKEYSDPCQSLVCGMHEECTLQEGLPSCVCSPCDEVKKNQVCGSDWKTYENECLLHYGNCINKTHVKVADDKPCDPCHLKQCAYDSVCLVDKSNNTATCHCNKSCSHESTALVCATDGRTYRNLCEMELQSCRVQQPITFFFNGSCDPCEHVTCKFGARCENGACTCTFACPNERKEEVCGDNGKTYPNECFMNKSSCKGNVDVRLAYHGKCRPMDGQIKKVFGHEDDADDEKSLLNAKHVLDEEGDGGDDEDEMSGSGDVKKEDSCSLESCGYGGKCSVVSNAQKMCVCHFNCPLDKNLICGSDNKTYDNECELKEESCKTQKPISVKYQGSCAVPCQCNLIGSLERSCDPITHQCACKPGVGGPKCDRCIQMYWGLPKIAEGNPGCLPCNCNKHGSLREDCEQMTGRCMCKPGVAGQKCNLCLNGRLFGSRGCTGPRIFYKRNLRNLTLNPSTTTKYLPANLPQNKKTAQSRVKKSNDIIYEVPASPSFHSTSYMLLTSPDYVTRDVTISLTFTLSSSKDAILLYMGNVGKHRGDFLAITIKSMHVEFRYNLGSGPAVLRTTDPIDVNQQHTIWAARFGRDGALKVDNGQQISAVSKGSHRNLDIKHGQLFIGGIKNITDQVSTQIGEVSDGLDGSIDELTISTTHGSTTTYNLSLTSSTHILEHQNINKAKSPTKISIPRFRGDSYIATRLHGDAPLTSSFVVELWFYSYQPSGVLMMATSGDRSNYFLLFLHRNRLQLKYKTARYTKTIISSQDIKSKKWHKVLVIMSKGEGLIMVDDDHPIMKQKQEAGLLYGNQSTTPPTVNKKSTNNADWLLYFGGYPIALKELAKTIPGFNGAFQRMYVNGWQLDATRDCKNLSFMESRCLKIYEKHHVDEYDGHPCPHSNSPCDEDALCMPLLNDHICLCRDKSNSREDRDVFNGNVFGKDDFVSNNFDEKRNSNSASSSCHYGPMSSVRLYGDHLLSYPFDKISRTLQLRFQTTANDSDLMQISFHPTNRIFFLIRKNILFVHFVNEFANASINSKRFVADGMWHKLLLQRSANVLKLLVDGRFSGNHSLNGELLEGEKNNFHDKIISIGGIKEMVQAVDWEEDERNGINKRKELFFKGCMESLKVDDLKVNLHEDRLQKDQVLIPCY